MKVLILTNNDGGLYHFRKELLQELVSPGTFLKDRVAEPCEVVASLPCGELVPEIEALGVRCIRTEFDRRGMNPIADIKLFWNYVKILKAEKPDIVFTYTIKPNVYGGMASAFLGVPYVANITGLGTAVENGGILQKITLTLYKIDLSKAQKVFFQNKSNMELFLEHHVTRGDVDLLPGSGVNTDDFAYQEYPDDTNGIRFLFVGRIMKDKGIEELLECAEYFHQRNVSVRFDLVGSYDEKTYEQQICDSERKGVVKFLGHQKDMKDFYGSHHVIIHPTYHEGMSNVLQEAAACGRPVLTTNVPGCQEVFEEGVSGFGCSPKDAADLIKICEKFLNLSHDEKREMGINARKLVEKNFDRRIILEKYSKITDEFGGRENV